MNYLELAQSRYTTKVYDPTKKVSDTDIDTLKEILRLAPSSINSQPWQFTFISNQELKKELAPYSFHNDARVTDCSHILLMSVYKSVETLEKNMPNYLAPNHIEYYEKRAKPKGDQMLQIWMMAQVYIALGYILPAIASLGIDSTPMEGIEHENWAKVLYKYQGESEYIPVVAVALGYRSDDDYNQLSKKPKTRRSIQDIINEIK
ncbi:oxygen-insensitive NADPH nitroreductase [Taylorella asinigenitalis 14/45]|uniref:Oxygen-insensitive NADPH nitroreductase n=1 Tax=Taylorella asinigenitalis 14/45 TaxID=1091495 RepID=I7JLF6_9BURK|nr:nitroreductase family protein [Taylorella asinigenitalis]CCG18963.1 oxygen-insensitive NADPH nitroreductase [Taylorella asinigenitalis 14/45]